ncbi:MAG: hypothetical protein HYR97_06455 [Candidatus Melainabacteria bacterium]|nr:hypothetical protein [Candidatus Melainabacteria bacterium]
MAIGTITKNNIYPPLHSYAPDATLTYHYGVVLLGSAINIFSHLDPWYCLIPIQIIFIFITPLIIFSLLHTYTNSFLQSIMGSIIGCLCANLTSFKLLKLITEHNPIPDLHKTLVFMNESGFAVNTSKAMISPNMSVAIPLSLTLFFLCTKNKERSKLNLISILFISIFLFFSYESFWLPVILAILIFYIFKIIVEKNKYKSIFQVLLFLILFGLSPIFVGGVFAGEEQNITNLIHFNPKSYIFSWSGILGEIYPYDWIINHEVISDRDGCKFYKIPFLSKYFSIEMGLPLLLLPFSFILLLRKKYWGLICFTISGLISFCLPFLISYLPREIETLRFFIYARLIFSILFGMFLGFIFEIKSPLFLRMFLRMALIILIITLVLPGIGWLYPRKIAESDYRFNKLPIADKRALKWLSKNAKPGDRGIGPFEEPWTTQEIITAGGVYGCSISPYAHFESETRKTAFITLDPCLLNELKIRWIYSNEKLLLKIPMHVLNKLQKEKILVLRYKYKNKAAIRKIYKFNPSNVKLSCENQNYAWAIGKMINGKFTPLPQQNSKSLILFSNKDTALEKLKQYQIELNDNQKAYWYRIEAIKI